MLPLQPTTYFKEQTNHFSILKAAIDEFEANQLHAKSLFTTDSSGVIYFPEQITAVIAISSCRDALRDLNNGTWTDIPDGVRFINKMISRNDSAMKHEERTLEKKL